MIKALVRKLEEFEEKEAQSINDRATALKSQSTGRLTSLVSSEAAEELARVLEAQQKEHSPFYLKVAAIQLWQEKSALQKLKCILYYPAFTLLSDRKISPNYLEY